jgi:hypothetical protein
MKPHAGRKAFSGLLLTAMALVASGCASDGTYTETHVGAYGYYGGYYPGYYHGDVIYGVPPPPPPVVVPPPPGGMPPPGRPPVPPPAVRPPTQLPARPLPAPAPRPMPMRR